MFPQNKGKMGKMLRDAQKMQQKLQEDIAALRVEATAGGGVVRAVVDGQKNLLELHVEPELLEDADAETVAAAVLAAVGEAQRKADDEIQEKMSAFAGMMGLPPGLGF